MVAILKTWGISDISVKFFGYKYSIEGWDINLACICQIYKIVKDKGVSEFTQKYTIIKRGKAENGNLETSVFNG